MLKSKRLKLILGFVLFLQVLIFQGKASAEETWSGDVSLGYDQSNGNTSSSSLSLSGSLRRMFDRSEVSAKIDVYTSSSNDKMDDQKWEGLLKTSFDIDDARKWYLSSQVLVDHDRFADIDIRTTPSAGIGYWIAKTESWEWNVEGQIGYELTSFRSDKEDENSMIALAKTYVESNVFEKGKVSEDLTLIPSLEGAGFRVKSESVFSNPLTEAMDFNIKYIVDFDSDPSVGKKKTDTRVVTGIKYSF